MSCDWMSAYAGSKTDPHMDDLVTVSREAARLGASALKDRMALDFYHNDGKAERELNEAAFSGLTSQPTVD